MAQRTSTKNEQEGLGVLGEVGRKFSTGDSESTSDALEHEKRTGEWKSPITGGWYKKNEETGKHEPFSRDEDKEEEDEDSPKKPSESKEVLKAKKSKRKVMGGQTTAQLNASLSEQISGIGDGLEEKKQREIEGMGWDQPILDVEKWKSQDPQGYEKARSEAFEAGRSGPLFSDIPKGVWDWGDSPKTDPNTAAKSQALSPNDMHPMGKGAFGENTDGTKRGGPSDPSTPRVSEVSDKLRHSMMKPETPEDRGLVNELGAFIFGDSTLGEDNVLGKILTGLFG